MFIYRQIDECVDIDRQMYMNIQMNRQIVEQIDS